MKAQAFANQFATDSSISPPIAASPSALWTRQGVLGALIAASRSERFPASAWPLQAGLDRLAGEVDAACKLGQLLGAWRRTRVGGRQQFVIKPLVRELIHVGGMNVERAHGSAQLTPNGAWLRRFEQLLRDLPPAEGTAFACAGLVVQEMVTISSKNSRAA